MLSRVAESIYWMARYLERADNTARFIQVSQSLSIDFPQNQSLWTSLILSSANKSLYDQLYTDYSPKNVTDFLTFDMRNPNSILSCLNAARNNARSIREIITGDLWESVNTLYFLIQSHVKSTNFLDLMPEVFHEFKMQRMTFLGLMENTLMKKDAYYFARVGRYLERADMTSRILDVKYFTLLPSFTKIGSAIDTIQWAALLDSTDVQEIYIKEKGTITPSKVADFLLLNRENPRSIFYCLLNAQAAIHAISGTQVGTYKNVSEQKLGRICSAKCYTNINEIITTGLHEYLDKIQIDISSIADSFSAEYFSYYTKIEDAETESQLLMMSNE